MSFNVPRLHSANFVVLICLAIRKWHTFPYTIRAQLQFAKDMFLRPKRKRRSASHDALPNVFAVKQAKFIYKLSKFPKLQICFVKKKIKNLKKVKVGFGEYPLFFFFLETL